MDGFELGDVGKRHREEGEDNGGYEETDMGGTPEDQSNEDDPLLQQNEEDPEQRDDGEDNGGGQGHSDLLHNKIRLSLKGNVGIDINHQDPYKDYFGDEYYKARNIGYFFKDVLLMKNEEVTNPKFIKYLFDTQDIDITKRLAISGFVTDYEISYYGEPYRNSDGDLIRPAREISTTNGVISNPKQQRQVIDDMRYHYDTWRRLELKKAMKKAGIATAIGLSITGLITGLALGLQRSGSDMVRAAKHKSEKAKKLTPAQEIIPWTEIEKASGKGLILIGDHIYLVIGGTILYLYTRRKHK